MSKSIMYAANTAAQSVAVGGAVNFGSIVRRYGCNCSLASGTPTVSGSGYYDVDTNLTVTAGAAGTIVVTMYSNGNTIPGAVVSQTVADGSVYALSIPAVVRTYCCNPSAITVVITGVAATVNNAAIVIEKE